MKSKIENFIDKYKLITRDGKLISSEQHEIGYIKNSNVLNDINKAFWISFEDIDKSICETFTQLWRNRSRKDFYKLLIFNEYVGDFQL